MSIQVFEGDDITITLTIGTENNAGILTPVAVPSGATVQAGLYTQGGSELIAPTAQSDATTGADWDNGVIVVVFPNASTAGLTPSAQNIVEIEIDNGGVISTYQSDPIIEILESYID